MIFSIAGLHETTFLKIRSTCLGGLSEGLACCSKSMIALIASLRRVSAHSWALEMDEIRCLSEDDPPSHSYGRQLWEHRYYDLET